MSTKELAKLRNIVGRLQVILEELERMPNRLTSRNGINAELGIFSVSCSRPYWRGPVIVILLFQGCAQEK